MLKGLALMLLILLVAVQHRLWYGEGGVRDTSMLRGQIEAQEEINDALRRRNEHLAIEVTELQVGYEGLEEKAREEMGLIKSGETFFLYMPHD